MEVAVTIAVGVGIVWLWSLPRSSSMDRQELNEHIEEEVEIARLFGRNWTAWREFMEPEEAIGSRCVLGEGCSRFAVVVSYSTTCSQRMTACTECLVRARS